MIVKWKDETLEKQFVRFAPEYLEARKNGLASFLKEVCRRLGFMFFFGDSNEA